MIAHVWFPASLVTILTNWPLGVGLGLREDESRPLGLDESDPIRLLLGDEAYDNVTEGEDERVTLGLMDVEDVTDMDTVIDGVGENVGVFEFVPELVGVSDAVSRLPVGLCDGDGVNDIERDNKASLVGTLSTFVTPPSPHSPSPL